jgi:hypothetical protein
MMNCFEIEARPNPQKKTTSVVNSAEIDVILVKTTKYSLPFYRQDSDRKCVCGGISWCSGQGPVS